MDSEAALPKVQPPSGDEPDDAGLEAVAWQAALGSLTGEVVHALNNGLFAVLANLELLLADVEPDSQEGPRLRLVQESTRELAEAVAALGALTRDDPGGQTLDELTRATADILRRTGPRRTIRERYPAEPLPVAADAAATRRLVVAVLLQVAAAAGPAGTLALEVAVEDGRAVLLVRSEGGNGGSVPEPLILAAQALARRLGGSLTVDERPGLRLELPRG